MCFATLALLVACTRSEISYPTSSASPHRTATTQATPTPERLPPLVLDASLDRPPVDWTKVAFLPGGDAEEQVGLDPCSECEPVVPAALAVDKDGSFWIADSFKRRIAHFADDGSFLEAIPVDVGPADLTFAGDRLYALLKENGSTLVSVKRGHLSKPITVNDNGRPLDVEALIGGQDHLLVLVTGAAKLLGGYWAYASVDPATGQVTPANGLRVPGGVVMGLEPLLDTRPLAFEIRWFEGDRLTSTRKVRFQLVGDGKQMRTSVGEMYARITTSGIATMVSLGDGHGLPVGRWYLEIPSTGRKLVFERLPDGGFIGDARRYLTNGADRAVFWMRLLRDGLHIYRR